MSESSRDYRITLSSEVDGASDLPQALRRLADEMDAGPVSSATIEHHLGLTDWIRSYYQDGMRGNVGSSCLPARFSAPLPPERPAAPFYWAAGKRHDTLEAARTAAQESAKSQRQKVYVLEPIEAYELEVPPPPPVKRVAL